MGPAAPHHAPGTPAPGRMAHLTPRLLRRSSRSIYVAMPLLGPGPQVPPEVAPLLQQVCAKTR